MRKLFLLTFLLSLFLSQAALAQETQDSQQLEKLSDNVYAYIGIKGASPAGNSYGANVGVVIGSDAVLVIDTLISAKQAKKLIANIKEITDKPIKYVVNTHFHLDHAWGNSEFSKIGATIIAHKNISQTEDEINSMIASPEMFGLTPEDMEGTTAKLPDVKIEDKHTVNLGNITVELESLGHSHTADSIIVLVKEDNVLFTGDIIFNKYHAYVGDGDIAKWTKVLDVLKKSTAKVIVPGHGPRVSKQDIDDMSLYINAFDKQAKELSKGKTPEDVQAITEELSTSLPQQDRNELPGIIGMNLHRKYLKATENKNNTYKK